MSAEERELMEEEQAIKAAQKTAKEIFGFPRETSVQVTKAQANPAAGSKGRGCSSIQFKAIWAYGRAHGAVARARSCAGRCCVSLRGCVRCSGRICLHL